MGRYARPHATKTNRLMVAAINIIDLPLADPGCWFAMARSVRVPSGSR